MSERRRSPHQFAVPVRGGDLSVAHWAGAEGPADGPVLVALHGITANGHMFAPLADALGDGPGPYVPGLYAPDLRGRAESAALPGPYGLGAHVADVIALLDHIGRERAVLVGHSMGAFVAALAAARHPDRVAATVLVDGGLGFPPPETDEGAGIDALLEAVIGPAMRRLSMTFPDRDSYAGFFAEHPALRPLWNESIRAHFDRDLVGTPPELRSSCVVEAVRADGADVLADPETLGALHRPGPPATLLWAERGMLDEPQGLYDEGRIAAAGLDPARVTARRLDGTNHYSVLLAPGSARLTADAARVYLGHTPEG
ncbi:alpha/beta hydrolase [Streptomyces sp. NPDC048172]|uniref:alpha/beta hydrolase n=1 Tax=Streptomyces sp. NPDC048172 TaxID=3365505 RepID=UPI0037247998